VRDISLYQDDYLPAQVDGYFLNIYKTAEIKQRKKNTAPHYIYLV
jgi:hypothetical protein